MNSGTFNRFLTACIMFFVSSILVIIGVGIIQFGLHKEQEYLVAREDLRHHINYCENEIREIDNDSYEKSKLEWSIAKGKSELADAREAVADATRRLKIINDKMKSLVFPTEEDKEEKKRAEAVLNDNLKKQKKALDDVNAAISSLNELKAKNIERKSELTLSLNNAKYTLNELDKEHVPVESYSKCAYILCFFPAFIVQLLFWFHIARSCDIVAGAIIETKEHLKQITLE